MKGSMRLHDAGTHAGSIHVFHGWDEAGCAEGIWPSIFILLDHLIILIAAGQMVEGGPRTLRR